MATLIVQGPTLDDRKAEALTRVFNGELEPCNGYYKIHCTGEIPPATLATQRQHEGFDINLLPEGFDPKAIKLLITDMDSTFINIECVDEIADFVNLKPEVAAITESAMRGEIDFSSSLRKRVKLLKDLNSEALSHVYNERLQLNPGGDEMLAGLAKRKIKIALVSGGFTFFTDRLKERFALDYTRANTLEIINDKLTGKVIGGIIGAKAKADFLQELCDELSIDLSQTVAMGDGANDLLMMRKAGLSVAYHAKPKVQEEADISFNYCGLEGILGLLDIS